MSEFVLATRGSELALRQAKLVRSALLGFWPGLEVREEIVRTTGDRHPDDDLAALGGSGVFTKELERVVIAGHADAAVHSLKDLPVDLPAGLVVGAVLTRANPDDVLVSRHAGGVAGLPRGARVGTGSPRRRAMMMALRSDVTVAPIRGNVPTRLAKAATGEFDAVILAAAGLQRLGHGVDGRLMAGGGFLHASVLPSFLPAPGQGAIAVEIRAVDSRSAELLSPLHHPDTGAAVEAERAVLRALGGGCHLALGARGNVEGGVLHLEAVLFDVSGAAPKHAVLAGSAARPRELGEKLAEILHGH